MTIAAQSSRQSENRKIAMEQSHVESFEKDRRAACICIILDVVVMMHDAE